VLAERSYYGQVRHHCVDYFKLWMGWSGYLTNEIGRKSKVESNHLSPHLQEELRCAIDGMMDGRRRWWNCARQFAGKAYLIHLTWVEQGQF
jgi:hypothetical protein